MVSDKEIIWFSPFFCNFSFFGQKIRDGLNINMLSIRGLDGSVTGNKFIDDPVICLSFIEIILFLTRKMLVEV